MKVSSLFIRATPFIPLFLCLVNALRAGEANALDPQARHDNDNLVLETRANNQPTKRNAAKNGPHGTWAPNTKSNSPHDSQKRSTSRSIPKAAPKGGWSTQAKSSLPNGTWKPKRDPTDDLLPCLPLGDTRCQADEACCSQNCTFVLFEQFGKPIGVCRERVTPVCLTDGKSCIKAGDCCSKLCRGSEYGKKSVCKTRSRDKRDAVNSEWTGLEVAELGRRNRAWKA